MTPWFRLNLNQRNAGGIPEAVFPRLVLVRRLIGRRMAKGSSLVQDFLEALLYRFGQCKGIQRFILVAQLSSGFWA